MHILVLRAKKDYYSQVIHIITGFCGKVVKLLLALLISGFFVTIFEKSQLHNHHHDQIFAHKVKRAFHKQG